MPLPKELDHIIRIRFAELITEAEVLLADINEYDANHYLQYREWVEKITGLLHLLFGDSTQGEKYQKIMEWDPVLGQVVDKPHHYMSTLAVQTKAASLKGINDNYVNGFYDGLEQQIVANMSADYMEQAEDLLRGKYHIPAAVLCGAVLENRLRGYCENHDPPLPTTKSNGDSKTLGALIDELDKVKAFDKQTRKLLKAWADIRNLAAHGKFDEFTREQVELMFHGVNGFLANHL